MRIGERRPRDKRADFGIMQYGYAIDSERHWSLELDLLGQ
jgi:hypothetical protein